MNIEKFSKDIGCKYNVGYRGCVVGVVNKFVYFFLLVFIVLC